MRVRGLVLLLGFASGLGALQAQEPTSDSAAPVESAASAADPAAADATIFRAARLTFFSGEVKVQRSDNTGDETPVLNMPLTEGTRLVAGDYGQAEIEFEDGSIARLTPRSALSLDRLSLDRFGKDPGVAHTELTLIGGLAYFELRKSDLATYTVNADGTKITPAENLTIRINLDQPPAVFAVLAGAAKVVRPDAFTTQVRAGENLRADPEDDSRYFLNQQIPDESWDAWNASRDQAALDEAARRTSARDQYAGDQGYGWSDLDANGNWYDVPGTGEVWQPDNADDAFDPYGYGNWVFVNTSYVWASGYAWGWTPFHCGQWQYFPGFGWGWQPDVACGGWGYGAGFGGGATGIRIAGAYPPRFGPVIRPKPRPIHPILVVPVHGPDGPRPAVLHTGAVHLAGVTATPLSPIAPATREGAAPVQALAMDFPIDRKTHEPVVGVQHAVGASAMSGVIPDSVRVRPGEISPRTASSPTSDRTGTSPQKTASRPPPPAAAPRPAPPAPAPTHTEPAAKPK